MKSDQKNKLGVDTNTGADIFAAPNTARMKVKLKLGTPDAIISSVNKIVDDMQSDYEEWLSDDIKKMREALLNCTQNELPHTDKWQTVKNIAHDVKGQGSTFGYPLITKISHSLHAYMTSIPPSSYREAVILAHVTALTAILEHRLRGDGGPTGHAILETLRAAIASTVET